MSFTFPGLKIKEVDDSQVVAADSSLRVGIAAPFLKGSEDIFLVTKEKDFIEKCGIPDPAWTKAYYACLHFLTKGNALYIKRVQNGASYACALVDTPDGEEAKIISAQENPLSFTFPEDENEVEAEIADDTADGTKTSFSGTLTSNNIKESSITFTAVVGASDIEITDDGAGVLDGDGGNITGTIDYTTGNWTLDFTTAPDDTTDITVDYIYLTASNDAALIYLNSKGDWGNDAYAFKVDQPPSDLLSAGGQLDTDEFYFTEYVKNSDNTYTEINQYIVSFKEKMDLSGNNIFIEEILEKNSSIFRALVNQLVKNSESLPKNMDDPLDMSGGSRGTLPDASEIALAWDDFKAPDLSVNLLIAGGNSDKTIADAIIAVAEKRGETGLCFASIDTPDDSKANVITYMNDTLDVDSSYYSITWPWAKFKDKYNNITVDLPPSGMVAGVFAETFNANPNKPPAGLNRGIVNVPSLKYSPKGDAELQELASSRINIIRQFPGKGKALFSQYTGQKKPSATSFINNRIIIGRIKEALNDAIIYINFEFINQNTYDSITSLVTNFMNQFVNNGIDDYDFKCDDELQTVQTKSKNELIANLVFVLSGTADVIRLNIIYTNTSARFEELISRTEF